MSFYFAETAMQMLLLRDLVSLKAAPVRESLHHSVLKVALVLQQFLW